MWDNFITVVYLMTIIQVPLVYGFHLQHLEQL